MSLFQCENCGCAENTALSFQGFKVMAHCFDWTGKEHLNGKKVCSACGPEKDKHGGDTECGKWHNQFKRTFLPIGMFKTNGVGNLEHKETGETNYKKYEIQTSNAVIKCAQ
jgi:hypothetical protein